MDDIICVIPEAKGQLNHGRKHMEPKTTKNSIDFFPHISDEDSSFRKAFSFLGALFLLWAFGLSFGAGALLGYFASFFMMGHFYDFRNEKGILPEITIHFHWQLF